MNLTFIATFDTFWQVPIWRVLRLIGLLFDEVSHGDHHIQRHENLLLLQVEHCVVYVLGNHLEEVNDDAAHSFGTKVLERDQAQVHVLVGHSTREVSQLRKQVVEVVRSVQIQHVFHFAQPVHFCEQMVEAELGKVMDYFQFGRKTAEAKVEHFSLGGQWQLLEFGGVHDFQHSEQAIVNTASVLLLNLVSCHEGQLVEKGKPEVGKLGACILRCHQKCR